MLKLLTIFVLEEDSNCWSSDPIPETDSTPHVNVGPQFQCRIPPFTAVPNRVNPEPAYEDLLWDPGISGCTDAEGKIMHFRCQTHNLI